MNYKDFEKADPKEKVGSQKNLIGGVPGSGKVFSAKPADIHSAFDNGYKMVINISEILAGQENRKRRFYRNLKKAIFAFSSVFIFSVFFIFAKKRKGNKCEKTKKSKN